VCWALSWLGRLVAAETRVRSQASKCQIYGGQKCHWDSFFRLVLLFPPPGSVSLQQCLILILNYMFILPEGQMGGRTDEGWEPSKKECFFGNRGALNTKRLTFREYLCSVEGTRKMSWRMGTAFCWLWSLV